MSPEEAGYRAVYSEAIRAVLNGHVEALMQAGWGKKLLAGLIQTMERRLRHNPNDFGEPLYTLRAMKIKVCVGFVRPFSVQFGIHEESKSVFVRKLVLMTTKQSD